MINPEKYAIKNICIQSKRFLLEDYVKMIEEIQKDAYNQAINDVLSLDTLETWDGEISLLCDTIKVKDIKELINYNG